MNRGRRPDNAEHDPVTQEDIEKYVHGETLEESAEDE